VETKALVGERGRYRLEQPIQAIQVPPTVQVMLAARIDRLPPEDKRLLQTASVIGKDVPFALLLAIAELSDEALRRGLDRLPSAEFLYETGLYPDLECSFKHALTHEVTYGGLLQESRRELHGRIVEAIETLHRDRLGEHTERLAHHALRGELREKAVHYLRQAGLKATARSALQDARAAFEQALGVLEVLPERPFTLEQAFDIRLEMRTVLNQLGEVRRMRDRLRETEAVAERLNDDRRRGQVCAFMTNVQLQLGEFDEALASGTRALVMARARGDLELCILTTSYLEQVQYPRGEYEQVVELATDNLAALPADWVDKYLGRPAPASVYDRFYLVMSLAQLGRFAEAAEYEAEAIRLAERMHHPFSVSLANQAAGVLHLLRGDWAKARSLMPKRLPAPGGVPEACPQRRRGDAVLTDREGPRPLGRRHTREKIVDRLTVLGDRRHDRHQLLHQALHQARLRADHVGRHRQLRLLEDGPELAGPTLRQPLRARPPLPLAFRQRGQRRRRRIGGQERPGQCARHLRDLERPRVVRLQCGRQLVDQAGLLADVPLTIFGEQFQLLGPLRARLQGPEVRMIRAQEVGQHARVERVTLGAALPKAIPGAVERLRIHGINHHAMVEQEIHHPAVGPLNRRPQGDALGAPLVQLPPHSVSPSAVCATVRAVIFAPLSSTTQTACG
jgi:tetratricopeptide (TPR) repeat protein